MKISMKNERLDNLKTAVDNGLKIAFPTSTTLKDNVEYPAIVFFGDAPISETPKILISLHYFQDNEGNRSAIFCGIIFEHDGSWFPIEAFIPSRLIGLFTRDWIIATFCDKIKEIKNDEVVCEKERTLIMYNSLDKNMVTQIIERMKTPGDERKAWQRYLETFPYPVCLSGQELVQTIGEDDFPNN